MARHSRLQKKNRKKLKAVDPFNTKGNVRKEREMEKKNQAPKGEEVDDQRAPRILLEIGEAQTRMQLEQQMGAQTFPSKKRKRNRVEVEAERIGYKKRRFESNEALARRITNDTFDSIKDLNMLAKFEVAGRAKSEIDKEYAEIDEKARRHKEQKERRREKILAKKRAERGEVDDSDGDDDSGDDDNADAFNNKRLPPILSTGKKGNAAAKRQIEKVKRKEADRAHKLSEREAEEKERLILAREHIQFGERYDAPPKFDFNAKIKESMGQKMAKAGGKNLLLKDLISATNEKKTVYNERTDTADKDNEKTSTKSAVTEADRQRVIDNYRKLKYNKRLANLEK